MKKMPTNWQLVRTGKMTPFLDLGIGNPFFAHERLWVRTDYDGASELVSTEGGNMGGQALNFIIGGDVVQTLRHGRAQCEMVEDMQLIPSPAK